MNDNVKEIESIGFGILSSEEIVNMSVCELDNTKLTGAGSVYDPRMGCNAENNIPCITCLQLPKKCPGHFGHITLNEPIIHPLFYKDVVSFLRCFCMNCKRLLITEDQIKLCGLNKLKNDKRFKKILEKLEKVDICSHCDSPQPKIVYGISDNSISLVYKEDTDKKDKISITLTTDEIKKSFESYIDSDVILCGFEPGRMHPRNLIMNNFPVIPPCARPFVVADGHICDDDLTNQIIEIIKSNNILKKDEDEKEDDPKNITKKQKALQSLKFRISTFYNNSAGKAKHATTGRPIKGLKERITGKEGQVRNNLMGKRVDYSARTVIGPDPTLPFGWIAIPKEIAEELTKPEMVCYFNKEYLEKIVNDCKANFIVKTNGTKINLKYAMFSKSSKLFDKDIIIRGDKRITVINDDMTLLVGDKVERNGKIMEGIQIGDIIIRGDKRITVDDCNFSINPGDKVDRKGKLINIKKILTFYSKKYIKLDLGDEVHRHLKDGDIVILNRQPTLHKGSMLGMKVCIRPGKTIRMNLDSCKTFNADFDGDEMNIHIPQSKEAEIEALELSAVKHNIISAQGSKPNIAIVQDSLTAAFLMTKENKSITRSQFFNVCMAGNIDGKMLYSPEKINTIIKVLELKGKKQEVWNGRGLISLLFPDDFIYEKKNDADPSEPVVKIYRGVLYEGAFDKNILGSSHNSLIQVINKEYGTEVVSDFISNIQFITNKWLLINGFSIGLQDCLINDLESVDKIQDKIDMCYIEACGIAETTHNPGIREVRITASLSKAKDVGMKIAKDTMSKNNNLLSTVYSGSKGDFFNIAQLTGLLGQQNLIGKRVFRYLNHGKRTLPHYSFEKLDRDEEYESRGFVRHSFIEGLNPQEFYFHAMSGREGICDTAMGTAKSGYIQRRIIKVCEDISVKYDGSVRDATGKIYQLAYGYNGLDPCCTVKVGNKQQACDISRIADKLNLQFEISNENLKVSKLSEKKEINVEPIFHKRIDLLRAIEKITGKKCLYKGVSDTDLLIKLKSLQN
jgi:DNA-directed RNA polymerase beta' subunit